jgi:cytochrome c556
MKLIVTLMLPFAVVACGGPQTPGAKAAHERHEHFEALGKAFKGLGDELKKDTPRIEAIRSDAAAINGYAGQIRSWFPAGSEPQDHVKTDALEAVWSQPDEFGRAAAKLADAAAALNAAAQSSDLAAVRGAVPPLGAACKGCHERFRHKD